MGVDVMVGLISPMILIAGHYTHQYIVGSFTVPLIGAY